MVVTPGEPAGIGPDLVLALAREPATVPWMAVADPELMRARARLLRLDVVVGTDGVSGDGRLAVLPEAMAVPSSPGRLDVRNAPYVLATLARATDGCLTGEFSALVTAPVQKSIIAEFSPGFSGHTEWLAERTGSASVLMLLAASARPDALRVALVTTHLPLAEVAAAITHERIDESLRVLLQGLRLRFGIESPRVLVAGLNPHAGESGHLGREEIDIIAPVIDRWRAHGENVIGPLPADTLFTRERLHGVDAVLVMYHDQGLPVLKHVGFGTAVNVTLGLPIVRTSVDHGTALDLAGSGRADVGSLRTALALAASMAGT